MEGADVVYHIAAAVEAFGPWSTFKSTNVDGVGSAFWVAAESSRGMDHVCR
jgi:thioester reductase-like protein